MWVDIDKGKPSMGATYSAVWDTTSLIDGEIYELRLNINGLDSDDFEKIFECTFLL